MLELLQSLSYWHWIILALILLGGEALGAAGFMIGIALSALGVAGMMAAGLLNDWQYQFLWFAILSVICSIIFWKFFRKESETDDAGIINDRAAQLVGRKLTLDQDIENGLGRIQLGDTFWKVATEEELSSGDKVEIYANEGMTLLIRRLD